MSSRTKLALVSLPALLVAVSLLLSGCAPLLLAGGAVGGYAVAKDMEDGQLIDSQKSKRK